jgi:hypothetical protein
MAKGLEKRYREEAMLIRTDIIHELESAMKSELMERYQRS